MIFSGKFQIEIDAGRGVLYLHHMDGEYAGQTALRICQAQVSLRDAKEGKLIDIVSRRHEP